LDTVRANPHHGAVIVAGLAKLVRFPSEIGLIDAPRRPQWSVLGHASAYDDAADTRTPA
jgi:hypothetical protein